MIHKTIIFLCTILMVTFSCNHNEGNFTISNQSDFDIDSLSVFPDSEIKNVSLKKGENIDYKILMNEAKSDGSYWILFNVPETNKSVFEKFGYFTNGYQIEDTIDIKILNDTILIDNISQIPY